MIKKLFGICTTLVPLALMTGNVALADTGSYRFTDTSSIRDDITQLGLDYQDYKLISDKNYDKTDVIALSESYIDSGNTKQIVNYVYVYNPYSIKEDVTSFVLKYNESSITQKVDSYTKDYFLNIVKYKVDFKMPTYSDLKRRYDISSLIFSNGSSCKIDFGCVYNQDGSNVKLDYDSYIFITGKDLFDYCPTPFKNAYNLTDLARYSDVFENGYSCILNSNDKSEYLKISENFHWVYFGSKDLFVPEFVYLNFDTNKKIDVINEIDLSYKLYKGKDKDSMWNGCSFIKCIQEIDANDINNVTRELVNDYSSNYLTLKNENNTFFRKSEYSDSWSDSDVSLSNFVIPAKNRLSNWSDSNFYNLLSSNAMKNSDKKYTARQSFENRQVSVLVDILPIYYSDSYVYKYVIEDLSVMRINYTTDMKVVNARCNSGALISSVNANDLPKVSFWDRLIAWFNDNFPYSLLIIGGAIIGLPIIISIVISLFTSGSSALLSGIAKGISKLVTSLIKGLVKLLVGIISLPFKFLGALFSSKKSNSNNNKSSKKK
ncbi:MAG: hypothetical protein BHW10_03875 [Clostridium sp. CAG:307_30_263]|nr:MAG: hypothetical protein BHW10_03875 [Clostridium sp. CAG:307_30_263]